MPPVVRWRDFGLKKLVAQAEQLGLTNIRVGIVGAKAHERSMDGHGRLTNAQVGIINHEGTSDGKIPPRRFLSEPFQAQRQRITRLFRDVSARILRGDTAESALDWVGNKLANIPRTFIAEDSASWDRNAETTIERKGFDHPLLWFGGLADAISHRIVRATGALLEGGASIGDYEHFEISGGDGGGE